MSYYYTYYIGREQDGKIYPLGPYDSSGRLCPVINRSRSFASDLHEAFHMVKPEQISDALRKEFEYENWRGEPSMEVRYLPLAELPKGSYVRKGYVLISQVQTYQTDSEAFDDFYPVISADVFAAKLQHEMRLGKNKPKRDREDGELPEPSASDFMYFAWEDHSSMEYEAEMIRQVAYMLDEHSCLGDASLVVLETEG